MFTTYYFDQKNNRHEIGTYSRALEAINSALEAIFDERWAKKAIVEKNGVIIKKYFG